MFYDYPDIMYENPPPPDGYEFDFDAEISVYFTFPRPQRVTGPSFIKIERNLLHKDLLLGKDEEQNSNTLQEAESAHSIENIESIKTFTTAELRARFSGSRNTFEEEVNNNKDPRGKVTKSDSLKQKIKPEPFMEDESAVVAVREKKDQSKEKKKTQTDSDKSISSKKKSIQYTKTPALESISKSYSRKSNSDSDSDKPRKSKSSSSREKSHSSKSSGHRKIDKDSKSSASTSDVIPYDRVGSRSTEFSVKQENASFDDDGLSKMAEISIKEEVLSDKDDNDREKKKNSKSSKKKYRSDSKRRLDEDHARDRYRDDYRKKRYGESSSDNSDDSRSRYSDDSRDSRSYVKREVKQESGGAAYYPLNDFYCDVCKLLLNSETTFSSHMAGKKHKKNVRLRSEQDVAKSQILDIEESKKRLTSRHSTRQERVSSPKPKGSQGIPKPPDVERIPLPGEIAKIQEICEKTKLILIGLDNVQEIRGYEETKYYCELCDAQCVSNSIIKHLAGIKHQLSCLKEYAFDTYSWVKDADRKDKRAESALNFELEQALFTYGRGRVKVFKDRKRTQTLLPEPYDPYQPSTSRQNLDAPIGKADELAGLTVTDEECLSRAYSDFYCKVCNSHMNNHSMWESHARGKRHAKNKKKSPGGSTSQSEFIDAPRGTISHLEELLVKHPIPNHQVLVGLNFVKEKQGENGDQYNCYLCGSLCSTLDVFNHLYLRKHKTRYLEKMLSNGYQNAVNEISVLAIGETSRESLINAECRKLLKITGPGKPDVAISKNVILKQSSKKGFTLHKI